MTAILWMLGGAAMGAGVALILYALGFCVELINCACQIITCNCEGGDVLPMMWDGDAFLSVLLFCTIGGAIIGLIYGIYNLKVQGDAEADKINAENYEKARKQRIVWAGEIKKKALNANNICTNNQSVDKPLVSTTYEAKSQIYMIVKELTYMVELQGKVESLVEELEKGGIKK